MNRILFIFISTDFAHHFALVSVLCALALTGCDARELGAHISATQAAHVDPSWVKAAKTCWPMLADQRDTYIAVNLGDPIGFRSTFPAYAALSDAQLEALAGSPLREAPGADLGLFRNSTSPLLTRQQAIGEAVNTVNSSDARDAKLLSPDTLCAIHTATPAGYR